MPADGSMSTFPSASTDRTNAWSGKWKPVSGKDHARIIEPVELRFLKLRDKTMQIGMMGLGRMGANMVRRLLRDGHECVVYDINPDGVAALVTAGAIGAASMEEFVGKLTKPRSA